MKSEVSKSNKTKPIFFIAFIALVGSGAYYVLRDKTPASVYYNQGIELSKAGKIAEAIVELKKAVRQDSSHDWANYMLGYWEFYSNNDQKLAKQWFTKQIKYHPNRKFSAPAYYEMCKILTSEENYNEAITNCTRSIELDPKFYDGHFMLGVVYQKSEDLDAARRHLNSAIAINPNLGDAYWELGGTYQIEGQTEEAQKAWDIAANICAQTNQPVACSKHDRKWEMAYTADCKIGSETMKEARCQNLVKFTQ